MQFARHGNPNPEGSDEWQPVTPEQEPTMVYDRVCEVRSDYDDELLAYLEEILPPFDLMALLSQDVQH